MQPTPTITLPTMPHPPETRAEALRLYPKHGTTETSRRTGVPKRTIIGWAKDAGLITHADEQKTAEARAHNAERVQAAWGEYRETEAKHAGTTAATARHALEAAIEAKDPQLIRALAISYGVMIDKAELLSGRATSRIETWAETELDTELRRLIEQMQ